MQITKINRVLALMAFTILESLRALRQINREISC